MAKISDQQIAAAARAAGFPGNAIAIAVAIALAESGGNATSHNPVYPDNSYGLWQINMRAHTLNELGISKNEDLYDPNTNARAAYKISGGGTNWKPWTTYTSRKYAIYLHRGESAAGSYFPSTSPDQNGNDQLGGGSGTTFDNIVKAFSTLTDSYTWVRVGLFTAGAILLVIGLFKLTGDNKLSDATKSAIKAAGEVAIAG